MSFLQAIVLGVVQGLTEFLPISSDGHLALVYKMFGMTPDLSFTIFLHFATLLAIIVYFWLDIAQLALAWLPANKHKVGDRRLTVLIVIGTFVTGVIALLLKDFVEPASDSFLFIGLGFLFTAAIMTVAELLGNWARRMTHPSPDHHTTHPETEVDTPASRLQFWKALPIGLAQGLAVMPGVSRSGSTIAAGMLSGLRRDDAAKFSFLLGIPIITLATVVDLKDVLDGSAALPPFWVAASGFVAAGLSGYFAIWWLLKLVRTHRLYWFAAYTGVLGIVILVLGLLGRG